MKRKRTSPLTNRNLSFQKRKTLLLTT